MIHNIIKILYIRQGYLPNYPYHMISDEEMLDSFIKYSVEYDEESGLYTSLNVLDESCYFTDNYSFEFDDVQLQEVYNRLCQSIIYHVDQYKRNRTEIPEWVYSYMFGSVVGPTSDKHDIHDLLVSLKCDNTYDEFTETAAWSCYEISSNWAYLLKDDTKELSGGGLVYMRPATVFGELHVLKSLRLQETANK